MWVEKKSNPCVGNVYTTPYVVPPLSLLSQPIRIFRFNRAFGFIFPCVQKAKMTSAVTSVVCCATLEVKYRKKGGGYKILNDTSIQVSDIDVYLNRIMMKKNFHSFHSVKLITVHSRPLQSADEDDSDAETVDETVDDTVDEAVDETIGEQAEATPPVDRPPVTRSVGLEQ